MSDHTTATAGTETTAFRVLGMTCDHCVAAVTGELTGQIPGVTDVQIDRPTGQVVVTSDGLLDEAAIAAAVDEAGYELAAGSVH